jgi:hypothetical protein
MVATMIDLPWRFSGGCATVPAIFPDRPALSRPWQRTWLNFSEDAGQPRLSRTTPVIGVDWSAPPFVESRDPCVGPVIGPRARRAQVTRHGADPALPISHCRALVCGYAPRRAHIDAHVGEYIVSSRGERLFRESELARAGVDRPSLRALCVERKFHRAPSITARPRRVMVSPTRPEVRASRR